MWLRLYNLIYVNLFAQYADKSKNETITGLWTIDDQINIYNGSSGLKKVFPFDLWVQTYDNNIYIRDIHRSFKYGGTFSNPTTTPDNSFIYSHEWGDSYAWDHGAQTIRIKGAASSGIWQWAIKDRSYGNPNEIFTVNNQGSGRVGINQNNPSQALDVNGNIKTNKLYLKAGNGIYSLHNNNYILNDHANGNVTLNAAGGNLYLGYINTVKVLLRKGLYDSSGAYRILSESGTINQTKTGVNNYFGGHIYLNKTLGGSAKLLFKGESSDMVSIHSENYDGGTATRLAIEVADNDNDYIQFRHKSWNAGAITNLMELKKQHTIIYQSLGIGKAPGSNLKLDVAGTIRAQEILVEAQTADFVFEPNYNLRDLSEVESFIKENKHLPEIPSAAEMEEQGVNLAEMNKLLLQKVEELTLYAIEKDKEVKAQNSKLKKVEMEIAEIKALLLGTTPNPLFLR